MNKTIATLTAAVVAGGSSLSAFVPVAADLTVTSDITYSSEYVFRGVEFADRSFQPSIEVSVADFYAGLFSNLPIENGQQSEIHYYGGFSLALPGVEGVILDLGGTVYYWPNGGFNNTHEVFVGTKFENVGIDGVSAAVYYFYDVDRQTHAVEGSVGYSFVLDQAGQTSLDLSAFYGNQFGSSIRAGSPRVNENYQYYGASAEVPYRLNEFSTVTAGAHYQTAERYNRNAAGRNQNLFWTISYTAGF